jgi:hypothetical protein
VQRSVSKLAARAGRLYDGMDFGFYYRPDVNRIAFSYAPSTGDSPCCYDTVVSESRIASYIGSRRASSPRRRLRHLALVPNTCDWSWQDTRPAFSVSAGSPDGDPVIAASEDQVARAA